MNTLAIDNSTTTLSIALKKGPKYFSLSIDSRRAAEQSLLLLKRILKKAKLTLSKIDLLAIGLGPGSFTGLRTSCSLVKGISFALNIPVVTLPSFYAEAVQAPFNNGKIALISDARRNLVYAAIYKKTGSIARSLTKERLISLEDFLKISCSRDCVFGGGSFLFKDLIKEVYPQAQIAESAPKPKARFLLKRAEELYGKGKLTGISKIEPIYLYPETCQIRKHK